MWLCVLRSRGNEENMQENKDTDVLIKELKEKLDWYTWCASEEEYDAKAVESILYLLDSQQPVEEADIPAKSEAWKRFKELVENQEELLPLPEFVETEIGKAGETDKVGHGDPKIDMPGVPVSGAKKARDPKAPRLMETDVEMAEDFGFGEDGFGTNGFGARLTPNGFEKGRFGKGKSGKGKSGGPGFGAGSRESTNPAAPVRKKVVARMWNFAMRHKCIAAAIVIMLILAISGTADAIATGNTGFFYWMKQDDTGTQMMTSPSNLEAVTDTNECTYLKREDMPEWTKDWLEIEEKFEMPEGYEWQYYEANKVENRQYIVSHYLSGDKKEEILIGVSSYEEMVSYNKEEFIDYGYVQDNNLEGENVKIYRKIEETGEIFYIMCFYLENNKYFVWGQDEYEKLKNITIEYQKFVKILGVL